jgi:hypothetical protein
VKLLLYFSLFFFPIAANCQTVLYVDSSVSASGIGTSWNTAYKTLNEALNVANAGSTTVKYVINVAKGTYYTASVQSSSNRDSTFFITRGGIKIYGGYPNGGGTRAVGSNPTILSGNIGLANSAADNSYHVLVVANITSAADTIIIDGLNMRDGYTNGVNTRNYAGLPVSRLRGAGMYCTGISAGKIFINN